MVQLHILSMEKVWKERTALFSAAAVVHVILLYRRTDEKRYTIRPKYRSITTKQQNRTAGPENVFPVPRKKSEQAL